MSKIASTYADALFDAALESNKLEEVNENLKLFLEMLKEQPQVLEILLLPHLSKKEKKQLIKAISEILLKELLLFLMVLIDNDRMEIIDEIATVYRKLVNNYFGIIEGTVYSATELSESQLLQLSYTFTKKLNQKVKLEAVVDSTLIGGYKVKLADVVYDNTIKLQLKQLKQKLMQVELK